MRQAARRDNNEGEIVAALEAVGCSVTRLSQGGVSDLLVGRQGTNFLIEVKTVKGKLTAAQVDFRNNWQGQYDVARSAEEALRIVGL